MATTDRTVRPFRSASHRAATTGAPLPRMWPQTSITALPPLEVDVLLRGQEGQQEGHRAHVKALCMGTIQCFMKEFLNARVSYEKGLALGPNHRECLRKVLYKIQAEKPTRRLRVAAWRTPGSRPSCAEHGIT
ncbi:hypothetical protein L915_01237 [Phytophthora nicotianae]|nr:hypothetical protein L915_01237 [Phytophthora nicotianae]